MIINFLHNVTSIIVFGYMFVATLTHQQHTVYIARLDPKNQCALILIAYTKPQTT